MADPTPSAAWRAVEALVPQKLPFQMTTRLAPLFVTLLFVAACDPSVSSLEDFSQLSQDPADLVGTWDWECDASFWSGGRCDPSEVTRTETLVFGGDGSLVVSRDGEVEVVTTYEVREDGSVPTLRADAFGDYVFGVDERRLVLFDEVVADGPERLFLRR